MRLVLWLAGGVAVVAVAAWLTRPGPDAFDAMLKTQLARRIATTDVGTGGDALATLALVGCKLRPSDCFEVIRQSLDVQFEDRVLFTRARVNGFGHEATCTGAFTHFFCAHEIVAP